MISCLLYTSYNEHQADDYLAVLKHELQALNITEPLKTIYIGGGTPSSLNDEQLEWLMDIIKPYISSETKDCLLYTSIKWDIS